MHLDGVAALITSWYRLPPFAGEAGEARKRKWGGGIRGFLGPAYPLAPGHPTQIRLLRYSVVLGLALTR